MFISVTPVFLKEILKAPDIIKNGNYLGPMQKN